MYETSRSSSKHPTKERTVFLGAVVSPVSPWDMRVIPNAALGVGGTGVIRFLEDLDRLAEKEWTEGQASSQPSPTIPSTSTLPFATHSQKHLVESLLAKHKWTLAECQVVVLPDGDFLQPGFIDTHIHACQAPNVGLGGQYELLDWLTNITFPRERRFADPSYAEKTYRSVVQRTLDLGTTTACYYATLHLEATRILAKVCMEEGQRALVGKCQMDRNAPQDYLEENVEASLSDTKSFISYCTALHRQDLVKREAQKRDGRLSQFLADPDVQASMSEKIGSEETDPQGESQLMKDSIDRLSKTVDAINTNSGEYEQLTSPSSEDDSAREKSTALASSLPLPPTSRQRKGTLLSLSSSLVQPILTPRFGISCTDALLAGISAIYASDPYLRLQTHLSESPSEITYTMSLFSTVADNYTGVYDHFNLLGPRTILAHCIHLTPPEVSLISKRQCGISHCPNSNLNLRSGAARVAKMLQRGIKVGLGTDASGGSSLSILDAIRMTDVVAKMVQFMDRDRPLLASPEEEAKEEKEEEEKETIKDKPDLSSSPLPLSTLLFLSTLGGAQVASLASHTGSLEVGKDFDALWVRMGHSLPLDDDEVEEQEEEDEGRSRKRVYKGPPTVFHEDPLLPTSSSSSSEDHSSRVEREDQISLLLQKFFFTGDDRSIESVWVRGRQVGGCAFKRQGQSQGQGQGQGQGRGGVGKTRDPSRGR